MLANVILKIGVDSGKGWLKITCSIYKRKEVEATEVIDNKRVRRSREDGIQGRKGFEDTGQRKVLYLAVTDTIP